MGSAAKTSVSGQEASAGARARSGVESSMSLFALPVSRGARLARLFVILALDLVLAGAGMAMIFAYLGERRGARDTAAEAADAGAVGRAKARSTRTEAAGAAAAPPPQGVESSPEEK